MDLYVEQISPENWKILATNAHKLAFGTDVPADYDRIDYALLVRSSDGEPCMFSTIKEINKYTAILVDGGAFPPVKRSVYAVRAYIMIMNWLRENYMGIRMHVRADNHRMIKLAMAARLSISGTEHHDGHVYVNLAWEDDGL